MTILCGCHYTVWPQERSVSKYLPRVDASAHTTILSTASKTVLSQTFVNPSSTLEVLGCKYVFPLYDGVSVVKFSCQVGSRTIIGVVKEKVTAKEVYEEAKARGEVRRPTFTRLQDAWPVTCRLRNKQPSPDSPPCTYQLSLCLDEAIF